MHRSFGRARLAKLNSRSLRMTGQSGLVAKAQGPSTRPRLAKLNSRSLRMTGQDEELGRALPAPPRIASAFSTTWCLLLRVSPYCSHGLHHLRCSC